MQGTTEKLHAVCCHGGWDPGETGEDDVQAAGKAACTEVGVPSVSHTAICKSDCASGNFALSAQMHKRRARFAAADRPYISSVRRRSGTRTI